LTIEKVIEHREGLQFSLGYPNFEVRTAFNNYLIQGYALMTRDRLEYSDNTYDALFEGDLPKLEGTIRRLFAGIPWRNFTQNDLLEFEGYYASVLYAFFSAIGCGVIPEDITNHGQADITVKLGKNIYVMEIKVIDGSADSIGGNEALRQIQERGYAEKYTGQDGISVFELGMVFSQEKRNLVQFDWEMVS
jgi:hypothetical protein